MPAAPTWTESEKLVLGWALATDGDIGLTRIRFSNTNRSLVMRFGGVAKMGRLTRGRTPTGKPYWRWVISTAREMAWFLHNVLPCLPSKRRRAKRLLRVCLEKIKKEDSASVITM